MAEVIILVEGYIRHGAGIVCSTCTLIRDGTQTIVVDPGTVADQSILIDALKRERLTVQDIDVVAITHSHLDHYRNIGLFPRAKSLDYWGLWDKDRLRFNTESRKFSKDIDIVCTPGHNYDGITLMVKTATGIVAVCGDIFWRKGYPKKDIYAFDEERLVKDREFLMKNADYVIPGHGPMFPTRRSPSTVSRVPATRSAQRHRAR